MKKAFSFLLVLALVLTLAACGAAATLPADEDNMQEISNPWLAVSSMEDAEAYLGYGMTAPETVDGLSLAAIRTLADNDNEILEVSYGSGRNKASIRKAPATTEDISGDYTEYAKTETVTIGGIAVTEKGDGENVFSAVWTKGEYSYAFFSTVGVSADSLAELISGIE